jgi:hypothetical protein
MKLFLLLFGLLISTTGFTQQYSIDWYKIAGGGGTSAGTNGTGVYSISGTIGQQDASTAMTGGFWSLISVLQTPGVPNLAISKAATASLSPGRTRAVIPCSRTAILLDRQAGQRAVIPSPPTAPTASPSCHLRAICFSGWLNKQRIQGAGTTPIKEVMLPGLFALYANLSCQSGSRLLLIPGAAARLHRLIHSVS